MPRPKDLHRKALLTTLHREDLNSLDKSHALLKEIIEQTQIPINDVPRILSTAVRRLDYQKRMKQINDLISSPEAEQKEKIENFELSDAEKSIILILLGLGLNPASVCANDFRALSLFPDLQKAIRELNLNSSHAMVLQRLSPKKIQKPEKETTQIRIKATQQVINQKLSLSETKKFVENIIIKQVPVPPKIQNNSSKKIIKELKNFSTSGLNQSELLDLRQELLSKLVIIDSELGKDPG